ncbi:MAG: 2-C-methyl-D-erythritol 4-phosphate cytidylyltransferase [Candidatus Koribacter versatilis]|uniref:2-C-methyl-D-erythritol 4-phosphate cytidylyltransferase n=1 Tax=Candidatus Korobacter versatilis TaxID=658062 RepID=A0A932A795_9BACT|nr:2-C-methyl-D-erythritol 4-phosphate cytidylyltransferase [Candidatus Koribacter versatilis]
MKVVVIIPAAGLGTRMSAAAAKKGKKAPAPTKQFVELNGVPILVHTLRKFLQSPQVAEIFLALRKAEAEQFKPALDKELRSHAGKKTVQVVEGGEHRQQSVANALAKVKAAPDDVILVHDAVRPFVDNDIIASVIAGAQKHGAAIAGVPAVDTIKQVDRTAEGAIVSSTIPRERVVQAQTPQGFRYDVLKKAFDDAQAAGFLGTDEASLVERMGQSVAVVMGSPKNIKITTPDDLELAEFFVSQEDRRRSSLTG